MENISNQLSYLKGLVDGIKVDPESEYGRIFEGIINVLDEINESVNDADTPTIYTPFPLSFIVNAEHTMSVRNNETRSFANFIRYIIIFLMDKDSEYGTHKKQKQIN